MCDTIEFCRICLENEELISVYPERTGIMSIEVIFRTTGIQITDADSLPCVLCSTCLEAIENAHNLRKKAEKSDALLKEFYGSGNDKDIIVLDELVVKEDVFESDLDVIEEEEIEYQWEQPVETAAEEVVHEDDFTEMKVSKIVVLKKNDEFPTASVIKTRSSSPLVSKLKLPAAVKRIKGEVHPTYICELCGKEVKRKARYIEHINTHTNSRPFHCKLCPLQFNAKNNLIRHMLVHSGEKPYKCDLCSNSYRAHHHLKYHKLQKHGNQEDRKYQCQLCTRSFVFNSLLTAHMKEHFEGSAAAAAKKGQRTPSLDECNK